MILENKDKRFIANKIEENGLIETIEYYLKELDCSIVIEGVGRPMQTVNFGYKFAISVLKYILDASLFRNDPIINKAYYDSIMDEINNIHINNIAYEKENPPIKYTKKGNANAVTETSKVVKQPKEKKPSKAELKLKEQAAKLSKLSVNFKIKSV